jgi:hypothetical protein
MKKRSLMVMMLIGLLGFGMIFGGCENGTTPNDDNEKEEDVVERVVAEKYRGTWKTEGNTTLQLFETNGILEGIQRNAYTEGTDLFYDGRKCGSFEDDTTLKYTTEGDRTLIFIKQP